MENTKYSGILEGIAANAIYIFEKALNVKNSSIFMSELGTSHWLKIIFFCPQGGIYKTQPADQPNPWTFCQWSGLNIALKKTRNTTEIYIHQWLL